MSKSRLTNAQLIHIQEMLKNLKLNETVYLTQKTLGSFNLNNLIGKIVLHKKFVEVFNTKTQ